VTNTTAGDAPTGAVEFFDGDSDLGPASALSGSGNTATATFTTAALAPGSHTIRAVYTPADFFIGSSGTVTQAVHAPTTLVVTNVGDTGVSGDGSPRGEIAAAASGDRIVFARSLAGQTITLKAAHGPLLLSKDLTIQGPGAARLTVSGNHATEVFKVAAGATDAITGLTIAGGSADGSEAGGGGGIANAGTLSLDHVTLSANHADGAFFGGGIFNESERLGPPPR
jgi:hypothetical protein